MEASIGEASVTQHPRPRPHYKAEFEKMCAYADELVADLNEIKRRRDLQKEMCDYAESVAASYRRSFVGVAAVAIVEALALIALMLR